MTRDKFRRRWHKAVDQALSDEFWFDLNALITSERADARIESVRRKHGSAAANDVDALLDAERERCIRRIREAARTLPTPFSEVSALVDAIRANAAPEPHPSHHGVWEYTEFACKRCGGKGREPDSPPDDSELSPTEESLTRTAARSYEVGYNSGFDDGQAADGWRDISSAPKDGHRVLLAGPPRWVSIGSWCSEIPGWRDDNRTFNPPRKLPDPTDWQPLPKPPSESTP